MILTPVPMPQISHGINQSPAIVTFQHCNSGSHDTQCSMRSHREARAPATFCISAIFIRTHSIVRNPPPYVLATELTTIMLPYLISFGAAFGYACFGVVFAIAGGAYFNAKNGAMEFASKHFCRSFGVVASRDEGPRSPEEHTHMSNLPQELRTSSMRERVSSSFETLNGYPITFVFGLSLATASMREVYDSEEPLSQA